MLFVCLYFVVGMHNTVTANNLRLQKDTLLVVTFEDHFKNDELNFKINDKYIFKGEIVSSNTVGYTDIEIVFTMKKPSKMLCAYGHNYIVTKYKNTQLLTLMLNGKTTKFLVDLKLGKYLGLSKKKENQLYLRQSKVSFFYD